LRDLAQPLVQRPIALGAFLMVCHVAGDFAGKSVLTTVAI